MTKCIVGLSLLFVFLTGQPAIAQVPDKRIHQREQLWLGAFHQTRFSNRWGMWMDVHYRMTDNFLSRPFQFLFRPALTYFIHDNLRINVGYALAKHYPAKGFNTTRTEHRPWQQVWWNQKHPGLNSVQWIRFEQRFNENVLEDEKTGGYDYSFRIRYNLGFVVPLKGKEITSKTPFATVTNEIFLNLGDKVIYNTFDQNRFFAGAGYQFTDHSNVQIGYMNIYQQEGSGNNYFSTHVIRLSLLQSLDLRNND
jgi:hypothetical protein